MQKNRENPGSRQPRGARARLEEAQVAVCFVSTHNAEPPHAPSPSRCILRSCLIRPHAHPWPAGQAAPPHIYPPGCARASGLLLTPPRVMRCEPAARAAARLLLPVLCAPWPWAGLAESPSRPSRESLKMPSRAESRVALNKSESLVIESCFAYRDKETDFRLA